MYQLLPVLFQSILFQVLYLPLYEVHMYSLVVGSALDCLFSSSWHASPPIISIQTITSDRNFTSRECMFAVWIKFIQLGYSVWYMYVLLSVLHVALFFCVSLSFLHVGLFFACLVYILDVCHMYQTPLYMSDIR